MAILNHKQMVRHAFIDSYCKNVPFFMGPAGIGKTAMIEDVRDMYLEEFKDDLDDVLIVQISGANLKEGELGGIPVIEKVDGKHISNYTTHVQLQKILDNDVDGAMSILFIDEFNRAFGDVQQELMDLVLARRINTTELPDNCVIIVAGNPPSTGTDRDYQVNVMNTALEDRFIIYNCGVDVKEWLAWAGEAWDEEEDESLIHPDIIDFIAEHDELLHAPKNKEDRYPTPRGWAMFSKSYRAMLKFSHDLSNDELEAMIMRTAESKFGLTTASTFVSFLRNKTNPIITLAEIFECDDETFNETVTERVKKETPMRQFVILERATKYISNNIEIFKKNKKNTEFNRFVEILKVVPSDSVLGIQTNISKNYKNLHDVLINNKDYLDIFFDINKKVASASI